METNIDQIREALLNAFLSLSPETAHLRDIAYAKTILWVFVIEDGRALTVTEIAAKGAELIQVEALPVASIQSALEVLKGRRMVSPRADGAWTLVPTEKEKLERTLEYSETVTTAILDRHFTQKIDRAVLRRWFNEVNKVYFSTQSHNLLSLYNNGEHPVHRVDEIVRPIIKQFGLEAYAQDLIEGYKDFLVSDNRDDTDRIFKFMCSLLSAKIVSAEISPDVLALDRYRNADVLLDTNVLFAMTAYKD